MNSGELFKARDMFRVPIVIVCPTCGRKHKEYIQVFNSFAQVRVILDGVDPYLIFIDKNDVWRETVCSGTICDKEECECDIDACHCDGACELCNEIHSDRDEDSDEC